MLPEQSCIADIEEGGPLRCYEDFLFGSYKLDTNIQCDQFITGIDNPEILTDSFLAYPNPTINDLIIEFKNLLEIKFSVIVFNVFGQQKTEIINSEAMQTELDFSKFPQGIYYVKIYCAQQIVIKKIIKI